MYTGNEISASILEDAVRAFVEAGGRGLTRGALRDRLNCNAKKADRARKILAHEENGAEFAETRLESEPKIIRFVMTTPPRWYQEVTPMTLLALRLATAFLDGSGGGLLAEDLRRVQQGLAPEVTARASSLSLKMSSRLKVVHAFDCDPTPLQSEVFSTLMKALASDPIPEVRVEWLAPDGDGNRKRLTLTPYLMTMDIRAGVTCLLAWDTKAKSVRFFQLPELQGAALTGKVSSVPDWALSRLELAAHHQLDGTAGEEDPFQVRLRIRDRRMLSSLVNAQPNFRNFRLTLAPTGAGLVEFTTNRLEATCRWVLQLGAAVEVLAPQVLRTELVQQARIILTNHGYP